MPTLYPEAKYRPLAQTQGQSRMAKHDIVCLHTMVGYLTSTDAMFKKNGWGGTESHFGIGGKWGGDKAAGLDGKVYQWQDTEFRADANLNGNSRIISIETADNAPKLPSNIEPWTPAQLDALVKLIAWACKKYDIPAVLIPDSKPGRRGIGYHRQGCQHSSGIGKVPGFLVVGGEKWSTSIGKECPGTQRIAQIPEIISRVKDLMVGKSSETKPPVKENEMEPTTKLKLSQAQADAMNLNVSDPAKKYKKDQEISIAHFLLWGGPGLERLYAKARASEAREVAQGNQLKALTVAVQALAANSPNEVRAAFNDGIANIGKTMESFKKELTELDVQVTLTDNTP